MKKILTPFGVISYEGAPLHRLTMHKKSTSRSGPARRSLSTRLGFTRRVVGEGGFFDPRVIIALLVSVATCSIVTVPLLAFRHPQGPSNASQRTLTFQERVSYQRAIEDVYWRHRIWPKENPGPKPSLDAVVSPAQLEKKVADYLRKSQALEEYWQRPITAEQLQAEMERIAKHTKKPEVLKELFEALGNDPFVIAECLARPMLAERLLAHPAFEQVKEMSRSFGQLIAANDDYTLPAISDTTGGCVDDTWTATNTTNAPSPREGHTAVWTGSEMLIWGGSGLNTGGSYNPATDSWTSTSTTNAPSERSFHTAIWTGSEMIVWGGRLSGPDLLNTGGRYNPGTESWAATEVTNAPSARQYHTAIWTGTEMIVWGGEDENLAVLDTGGKYDPNTDSWTATTTNNAPTPREVHTAVWTGSEMVIWGGFDDSSDLNTGGKYDPSTDNWAPTSTTNAPIARESHTAVWTSTEMIVWGGLSIDFVSNLNTGGRYNPVTNSWAATSTISAPSPRETHTAVWTGSEMITWGGVDFLNYFNIGGRYNPSLDSWLATNTTNAPSARAFHTAVWTGSKMIVWSGGNNSGDSNTGGIYCAQSGPTPTATPRATPRPRPTPHRRPTPPMN